MASPKAKNIQEQLGNLVGVYIGEDQTSRLRLNLAR